MNEKKIKSLIRTAELRHGVTSGMLEAVAWIEYAKRYGWNTSKLQQLHPDGTSIGLFGLRESTSVAEYIEIHRVDKSEVHQMMKTVRGQAEIAAWYLGRRIPNMLRHYELENNTINKIVCYNAGISRAISGKVPQVTAKYIEMVQEYINENDPRPSTWGLIAIFAGLVLAYFLV